MKTMKTRNILLNAVVLFALCGAALAASNADQPYDLVILNGRVMNPESNFDGIRNVGVKDGKIAAITEKAIKGKESIDASGHVVAPGFIDGHHHNVVVPFGRKLALRDGVHGELLIMKTRVLEKSPVEETGD